MGMFDTIVCEYPLPEPAPKCRTDFQTKSLLQGLAVYKIDPEGKLWMIRGGFDRPDEQHPSRPLLVEFHGWLKFYHDEDGVWYEYLAKFMDGQLVELQPYPPRPCPRPVAEEQ